MLKIKNLKFPVLLCSVLLFSMIGMDGCSTEQKQDVSVLAGNQPVSTEPATKPEVPEGAIVDASGDFVYTGKLQTIGDITIGFMQVPLGYLPVEQEQELPGIVQYCDATGANLITFGYYQGITYQALAESRRSALSETEGIDGLTGATTTVGDYSALQLYCYYKDETTNTLIVAWFIPDQENPENCYFMEFELDSDHQNLIACSSTFQTVTDYLTNPPENIPDEMA
ncbi:MAG: hypothetical protein K2H29_05970 [Oscillospiraceae bacterium]|nr:hypothetical protein [Oscillospiraceae bacterium]